MSALSANTLFHFTKNTEILLSILENGFRPSYSKEFGEDACSSLDGKYIGEFHVPMTCFCDIPLSRLENHIGVYGSYGVGLSKDWGLVNKLNPVTYINPDSHFFKSLIAAYNHAADITSGFGPFAMANSMIGGVYPPEQQHILINGAKKAENHFNFLTNNISSVLSYMKPHKNSDNKVNFYDEREWRYVVPFKILLDEDLTKPRSFEGYPVIFKRSPLYESLDKKKNELHSNKKNYLKFNHSDIKYIILKTDNEIDELIKGLEKINSKYPNRYPKKAIERITSRIITCDQIKEDF